MKGSGTGIRSLLSSFNSSDCTVIRREFACLRHGRPDRHYLKYRWQPKGCTLPRFDGLDILSRMRGKRIMFVGDSISRTNQWQSLVCLLMAVHGEFDNITTSSHSSMRTFTFQIINVHAMGILRRWDLIEANGKIVRDMDRLDAFRKALTAWAKWVSSDVKLSTEIFFQGISPSHYKGVQWNKGGATDCSNETTLIKGSKYRRSGEPLASKVLSKVLTTQISAAKRVHLLDITTLSQLRKDGHPGRYNGIRWIAHTGASRVSLKHGTNFFMHSSFIRNRSQLGSKFSILVY